MAPINDSVMSGFKILVYFLLFECLDVGVRHKVLKKISCELSLRVFEQSYYQASDEVQSNYYSA